jgi:hypothetical protein
MSRGVTPSAFASTLAVLSLLACGGARREASAPGPARPVNTTSNVLTATCRSMSYDRGTMDVITGLSFALRVVTFQVDEDTEVMVRGRRGALGDLAPGKVVRIQYRKTPQGNQADRIEEVMDSAEMR